MPPPSPEQQLVFLTKLQRLFAEGDFTATYKFALLIALADLAVELGHDDDEALRVPNRELAVKFIELYWQQSVPYTGGVPSGEEGVLSQNNGGQAAIITAIIEFRANSGVFTANAASALPSYDALVQGVTRTVADQPVRYLQNLGGQLDQFLYRRESGAVVLHPGVCYCLRRFQPLVQQLARTQWIQHVKRNRRNLPLVGDADDLESFLFETSRQTLAVIGSGLTRLVAGRCFYCGHQVDHADVDHFVPFSMYPRDLIHNFVLAHQSCNRSKSDTLAARPHLERWLEFVMSRDDDLREIGELAGCPTELVSCRAVVRWGYTNALTSGAQAWLSRGDYEPVDAEYLRFLS